jgi:hypothetical protein
MAWARIHAPALSIVLMTTDTFLDKPPEDAGFAACLVKPFGLDVLLDCVAQYVLPRAQ